MDIIEKLNFMQTEKFMNQDDVDNDELNREIFRDNLNSLLAEKYMNQDDVIDYDNVQDKEPYISYEDWDENCLGFFNEMPFNPDKYYKNNIKHMFLKDIYNIINEYIDILNNIYNENFGFHNEISKKIISSLTDFGNYLFDDCLENKMNGIGKTRAFYINEKININYNKDLDICSIKEGLCECTEDKYKEFTKKAYNEDKKIANKKKRKLKRENNK